jgi:hypothetical protein
MQTKNLEDKVKKLEEKVLRLEENQVRNGAILFEMSRWFSYLQEKSGDKVSPLGTKCPQIPKSRDKVSPLVLDWCQPWKAIVGPVFKPAKSYWDFERRYLLRSQGPSKYIELVIALLMAIPENHNFYVKSKRCYVFKDSKWEQVPPKDFYPQLRNKILEQYCNTLLRSQLKKVEIFAASCLKCASLNHWTNQFMEEMFNKTACRNL